LVKNRGEPVTVGVYLRDKGPEYIKGTFRVDISTFDRNAEGGYVVDVPRDNALVLRY
jgi:hypothetical protein